MLKETPRRAAALSFRRMADVLNGGGILPTAVFCLVISAFAVLVLRCAFYGVHTPDEGFYVTVPYRLYLGEALIIDELQESQFSAFLQYLPFAAFMKMTGSTDGVILYFRLLFVLCQTAVSFFIFFRMKRFGGIGAVCAAVLYLVYVPEFVESLDYYTMSLMPVALIAVILFTSDRLSVPKGVFIGILAACAVVAQPMLAFVYFAYTAAVFVGLVKKKKKETAPRYTALSFWVGITAGIVITAVLFFVFLLSRASLREYIDHLGNLFSGYNHILPFTPGKKSDVLRYGVIVSTLFSLHPVGFPLSVALTAGLLIDRRRLAHRTVWCFILGSFYVFYVAATLIRLPERIAQGMFSPYILFVFTLHCYLLTVQKNKKLLYIWSAGLVYVLCLGAISHALKYAGVVGCAVSDVACAHTAGDLLRELRQEKPADMQAKSAVITKAAVVSLTAVCVFSIAGITAVNAGALFVSDRVDATLQWDGDPVREKITSGPMKGITVSHREKTVYEKVMADFTDIRENYPGRLYIEGQLPLGYLMSDAPFGTCSAYYVDKPQMLEQYFSQNPERIPRVVYFPTQDMFTERNIGSMMLQMFLKDYDSTHPFFADYTRIKGEAGYILIAPDDR